MVPSWQESVSKPRQNLELQIYPLKHEYFRPLHDRFVPEMTVSYGTTMWRDWKRRCATEAFLRHDAQASLERDTQLRTDAARNLVPSAGRRLMTWYLPNSQRPEKATGQMLSRALGFPSSIPSSGVRRFHSGWLSIATVLFYHGSALAGDNGGAGRKIYPHFHASGLDGYVICIHPSRLSLPI